MEAVLNVHLKKNGLIRWGILYYGVYTMEYIYTHIYDGILLSHKKNKMIPFPATLMDLEIVILSEVYQTKKDKYHMISFMFAI